MKKQRKQLIVMVVFLAVLIAAYIGIGIYNDAEAKKQEVDSIVIMNFDYEKVVAFSYDYEDTQYTFSKTDETWTYDAESGFDVDETLVKELLASVSYVLGEDAISEYDELGTYGLDAPQKTISFTFMDGTNKKVFIGDYNDILGFYYLMIEGDDTLYLADSTLLDAFEMSYTSLAYIEEETEEGTEVLETTETE